MTATYFAFFAVELLAVMDVTNLLPGVVKKDIVIPMWNVQRCEPCL